MDMKSFLLVTVLTAAQGVTGSESDENNVARGKFSLIEDNSYSWLTDGNIQGCKFVSGLSEILIDLQNVYQIRLVTLYGPDHDSMKGGHFEVSVANQDVPDLKEQYASCSYENDVDYGYGFVCSKKGDLVRVRKTTVNRGIYELCEIKVFRDTRNLPNLELRNSIVFEIPSISLPYAPMQVLVVQKKAKPIFVKPSTRECVLAVSTVGEGKVIVSGERAFLDIFRKHAMASSDNVWRRLGKWLAKGKEPYFVKAHDVRSSSQFTNHGGIILWTQYYDVSPSSRALIMKLLRSGNVGVMTGDREHNVEQIYGPYQEILDEAGVVLINKYGNFHATEWTTVGFDDFQLVSVEEQVQFMLADRKYYLMYPDILDDLNYVSPKILEKCNIRSNLLSLLKSLEPYMETITPSQERPTKTEEEKLYNTAIAKLMTSLGLANTNRSVPNVSIFPGLPAANATEETVTVTFLSNVNNEIHSTSLYLAPGRTLKIKVLSSKTEANSWQVRVGCHTDDISPRSVWPRYRTIATPFINVLFGEVFNGFGGTIWIRNTKQYWIKNRSERTNITLEFSGVIRAPFFDLRDKKNMEDWNTKGRHHPAPWAEISSDKVIFTVPSHSVRKYNSSYLTDLMTNLWDLAVKGNFWLLSGQWEEHTRQRFVLDKQISYGYGHAGYPIMLFLNTAWLNSLLDSNEIRRQGSWGASHELGHNMQDNRWTFHGTIEVTCNIFSYYNKYLWGQDFFDVGTKEKILVDHLENGATYNNWISNPYLTLQLYRQVAYHFGFSAYRNTFNKYTNEVKPKTDQEKRDLWLEFMSKSAGRNLCALFEFWGYIMSNSTKATLKNEYQNTVFFPNDTLTRQSSTREKYILHEYRLYQIDRESPLLGLNGNIREQIKPFTQTVLERDIFYH